MSCASSGLESLENCFSTWMLLMFYLSIIPPLHIMGIFWVGILRFASLKIFVIYCAVLVLVRSCLMHELPSGIYPNWIVLQALVIPSLFIACARALQVESRTLFWAQRQLRGENTRLMSRLETAERALKFEAPTPEERAVVSRVLGAISIPRHALRPPALPHPLPPPLPQPDRRPTQLLTLPPVQPLPQERQPDVEASTNPEEAVLPLTGTFIRNEHVCGSKEGIEEKNNDTTQRITPPPTTTADTASLSLTDPIISSTTGIAGGGPPLPSSGSAVEDHNGHPTPSVSLLEEEVVEPLTNDIVFEELELMERIGAGAFGEVIKAQYNGRLVAVKRLLRARLDEENIQLFVGEITLLRGLNHPNIVEFLGASWDNVVNLCIVFEFMERGSLSAVLGDKSLQLTWDDPKLKMMLDAARGIHYLHTFSPPILHRDIKADNVLVTSTFGCKIGDLGAARQTDEFTMTQVGTPMAVAPEVMAGDYYSTPADVYSFGIMLLEVHLQRRPYDASLSANHIRHKVQSGGRPTIPADARAELRELIQHAWHQDQDVRPSMAEVVVRLRQLELPHG